MTNRLELLQKDLIKSAFEGMKKGKGAWKGKICRFFAVWLPLGIVAGCYGLLIWWVLSEVFPKSRGYMDDNVTLIIVLILILATIVLILTGVFALRMRESCLEEKRLSCQLTKQGDLKKDKALEDLKEMFLKKVVDDILKQ